MNDVGYRIQKNVISIGECEVLAVCLSKHCLLRGRAGARHLMKIPEIAALANDARLLRIARQELGIEAVPFRATFFSKSMRANWLVVWHQDTALPLESHFI